MLRIKPYEPSHHQATAALWLASWHSTGISFAGETTHDELARRIPVELAADWSLFLAWEDDALVGLLALKPATSCLDQLFVLPAAQGRGIGAALLDFAKSRLPAGMGLGTAAENAGARRFYERQGFRLSGAGTHPRLGYATVTYSWP